MAKVKVKGLGRLSKSLGKDAAKKVSRAIYKQRATIEGEIVATIFDGKSPVKGKSFVKYSDSYSKIKGKKRPVDMFLSGKMLKSIKTRITKNFGIRIFFTSPIAVFHDILGAGKSKVIRRLLPDPAKGETFKPNILKAIRDAAKKAF